MYAVWTYGFGININNSEDRTKKVAIAELYSAALSTLPLAIAAFAVNTNFIKPRWIWSTTLLPPVGLLTYLTAKEMEAQRGGFTGAFYLFSAPILAGIGIGLAPPTTKILSTKLRITAVGAIVPILVAAAFAWSFLNRSANNKD